MNRLKQKFQEDPVFATAVIIASATAAAALLNSVARIIGSSGYAVHAAKRK